MSCSTEDGYDGEDGNANEQTSVNAAIVAYGRTSADEIVTIPFIRGNRFYFFSLAPNTNEIIFTGESLSGPALFLDLTDVRYTIIPSN